MISTLISYNQFWQLLLCSYATGWVLIARCANQRGIVDLCYFVRSFILAPFVFSGIAGLATIVIGLLRYVIVPNVITILSGLAIVFASCGALGLLGFFVLTPAVKKVYGVAKPFSEKICIVVYRRK